MVKLTGPGLAQAASGSIGGELTFSTWKGQAYLKKKSTPAQPNTDKQIAMRAILSFLAEQWSGILDPRKQTWQALADETKISAFNAYQALNTQRWRRLLPPSQVYPALEIFPYANPQGLWATGGVRQVQLRMRAAAPYGAAWTGILFHQIGAPPAVNWDNLVHIHSITAVGSYYWTHTPLTPAQHFYRLCLGSVDGNIAWAVSRTNNAWST